MMQLRIEKLTRNHELRAFDCGQEELNQFLIRFARQNQSANGSQTYVAVTNDEVVGFYTLAAGHVEHEAATPRLKKGLARYPVPVMLLARLATSKDWQGRGIGSGLLKDAMRRTAHAADIAGIRALLVHAKDDNARSFYEKFDFEPLDANPIHLYALVKQIRRYLGESQ